MRTIVDTRVGEVRFRSQMLWMGNGYQQVYSDWRWDGPPLARISCRIFPPGELRNGRGQAGQQAMIGPYTVQIIELVMEYEAYLVRRIDQHGFTGWLLAKLYQGMERMTRFNERVIMTLAIWGLAEWPEPGMRPTFAQVKRKWLRAWYD